MARSIGAIVLGFVLIGLLSFGADAALRGAAPDAFDAAGRVDSVPVLLLMLGYVAVFAIAGCYVTARMSPSHPMRHALILGALGLAFNIAGSIALWDTAPVWYHVVALALVMPLAWTGGRLREIEVSRRPAVG